MPRAANRGSPTRRASPLARFNPTNSKSRPRLNSIQERRLCPSKPRLRLETTQRDVFDWYEKNNYRDDGGAIFSPEWQCRLKKWGEEFDSRVSNIHDTIELHQHSPTELELGCLFQAHPILAFSLWHVLQACYELDRLICGTTIPERKEIIKWQDWRPFQYLLSPEIKTSWRDKLRVLSSEAAEPTDNFKREDVVRRLHHIAHAVHTLEEAFATLTSIFKARELEKSCAAWVLDAVQGSIDTRYHLIERTSAPN